MRPPSQPFPVRFVIALAAFSCVALTAAEFFHNHPPGRVATVPRDCGACTLTQQVTARPSTPILVTVAPPRLVAPRGDVEVPPAPPRRGPALNRAPPA